MKAPLYLVGVVSILAFGCTSASADETGLGEAVQAVNFPITCAIRTKDGHYVTAFRGGGRTTDVLHTDATRADRWEKFTLVDAGLGTPVVYGIRTATGNYLSAVDGGGRTTDVIHSDAKELHDWERFTLEPLGDGLYAIKTVNGHYLTATGGGGKVDDAIHSGATKVADWERFGFDCEPPT